MNLSTIAKLAGVSVSTVSKAFAGSAEISDQTREQIYRIARENGCFDKYIKHKYNKKVVAVICPEMLGGAYPATLATLDRMIAAQGGLMISSATNFSDARKKELFTYYSSYGKVDGIIVIGSAGGLNNSIKIPLVSLFNKGRNSKVDTIQCDVQSAMIQAIECLKQYGHTRIGFAGEHLTMGKVDDYRTAMEEAGLYVRPNDIKVSAKRFEEAGMEIMEQWLAEKEPPTAIIAAYDNIAMGIVKSIRRKGLRVPEDFSVIGIDDIPLAAYTDTSLSSIRTFREEACQAAVDLLMKKIENQYYTSRQEIIISTELILRDSVGQCPGTVREAEEDSRRKTE